MNPIAAERDADQVCISIRDSEIGISKAQIDNIFDLFTQLDDATP
jgi:signal transduction histidine kinase